MVIKVSNAERGMRYGLSCCIGEHYDWPDDYSKVVSWLSDNEGRGLLLMGPAGVGKSLLCEHIIPVLIYHQYGMYVQSYQARELNTRWDEIVSTRIICIDDVGTEDVANTYGERHVRFADLVDLAEREDKLLILSTNLSPKTIAERYGERTISRLHHLTKGINIIHKDMRS